MNLPNLERLAGVAGFEYSVILRRQHPADRFPHQFTVGGIAGLVGVTDHSEDARLAIPILGGIGGLIFIVLMTLSLPGIVVGVGLLRFRPWAHILGIVLSVLDLIHVPLGTAVGIYGFWVLLSPETERLFRAGPSQPVPA